MTTVGRQRWVWAAGSLLAAGMLALPACENGGHFTLLGYTTKPNYDCNIHTVRVPIFKNLTQRDSVRQGIEFDLTRAVIRDIEAKTPYKVVSGDGPADTELTGTIVTYTQNILNRNQLNEKREAETVVAVEVVWRDLRSGEILSGPRRAPESAVLNPDPGALPPPPPPAVLVTSSATFIPELGESFTTARQMNVNKLATQIVSMMEIPW